MEIVIALVTACAALAGAAVGARATRKSGEAAAATAERVAAQARTEETRRIAAKGYTDATVAVEWLSSLRVEDSVMTPHAEELEPEYLQRAERLRRGRDLLLEAAALSQPLARSARLVAQQLGQLDEAWRAGRSYTRRRIESRSTTEWFDKQLMQRVGLIDNLRASLLGVPDGPSPIQPDVTEREGGSLAELGAAIAGLDHNEQVEVGDTSRSRMRVRHPVATAWRRLSGHRCPEGLTPPELPAVTRTDATPP